MTKARLSFSQIWNMCCGLFGVQIVWGLQNVNTSRIFQTLGADVNELAILWIAAPGHGPAGPADHRPSERPHLGAAGPSAALSVLRLDPDGGVSVPDAQRRQRGDRQPDALGALASINVAMEPFRAFVADSLPEEQRTTGFAMQVFFIGAGAVFASALPWVLTHWFGVSGQAEPGRLPPRSTAFYVGGVTLLAAVMWTVFTTSEHPPETLADGARVLPEHRTPSAEGAALMLKSGALWTIAGLVACALAFLSGWAREIYVLAGFATAFGAAQLAATWLRRQGKASLGVLEVVEDMLHMPQVLIRLAVVQFFTWFGLFAMWIYTTPAVTARHYGSTDPASAAYNQGADWVGVLFAGYNGVAALVALLLPALVARIGLRASHALCLAMGALGFVGFVMIDDPALLWMPIVGIGVAWASILSAPYAMLSSAVPPHKMGVYMGIHNLFLVLPQLIAAVVLGPVVGRLFKGEAILALGLAAAAFALAAVSALAIRDPPRQA
jgi:maltose/moltooligosaccharide transporter